MLLSITLHLFILPSLTRQEDVVVALDCCTVAFLHRDQLLVSLKTGELILVRLVIASLSIYLSLSLSLFLSLSLSLHTHTHTHAPYFLCLRPRQPPVRLTVPLVRLCVSL